MNKSKNILLNIPHLSQYRDIFKTVNAHRACGMTCVKMILDYHKIDSDSLETLVGKYIDDINAYGPSGWKHDFFVELLNSFGLQSHREEKMTDDSVESILKSISQGNPVIVSVEQRLFDKKLFHMVLIVGVKLDEKGDLYPPILDQVAAMGLREV